jgi:hypothetical protein
MKAKQVVVDEKRCRRVERGVSGLAHRSDLDKWLP